MARWVALAASVVAGIALGLSSTSSCHESRARVVWSIAGSDSGGGAGVEADVRTIGSVGAHACAVVTALTAQNSVGVTAVAGTAASHVASIIATLDCDIPPDAVKIGMLCNSDVASVVADFVERCMAPIVIDPILVSSSGRELLDAAGLDVLRQRVLPACTVITPNAREASVLIGRPVESVDDLESAACDLAAQYGCAVVVKGGHVQGDNVTDVLATPNTTTRLVNRRNYSVGDNDVHGGAHGTGCVLSSALAARLALGDNVLDAVVAAKALCAEAIACAQRVGNGSPVASPPQMWPSRDSAAFMPGIPLKPRTGQLTFPQLDGPPMRLYALADSADRAVALFKAGVRDVQLRIKRPREQLKAASAVSMQAALACGARLWINDDWQLAAEAGAYGVHLGQEDLNAVQDLDALARSGLRLGVSTHCLSELAVATYLRPSYVALGPIYGTTSKQISFDARGISMIADWRKLVPKSAPLIAIGGIDLRNAPDVLAAGADSIAVISALPPHESSDLAAAVQAWTALPWPASSLPSSEYTA